MFELFKLLVDGAVLRDGARKGLFTWRVFPVGFGFAIFLYAVGLPAAVLYQNHPQYKMVFYAAMAVDGVAFILFMIFGLRWYIRSLRRLRDSADASQ